MIKTLFPVGLSLFVLSLQASELETKEFFFCLQKKARAVESRTVRIHQFPEENKCIVVYSVYGQDQMISQGSWFSFCEKKAKQVITNLQEGLWDCKKHSNQVKVFYSFSSAKNDQ